MQNTIAILIMGFISLILGLSITAGLALTQHYSSNKCKKTWTNPSMIVVHSISIVLFVFIIGFLYFLWPGKIAWVTLGSVCVSLIINMLLSGLFVTDYLDNIACVMIGTCIHIISTVFMSLSYCFGLNFLVDTAEYQELSTGYRTTKPQDIEEYQAIQSMVKYPGVQGDQSGGDQSGGDDIILHEEEKRIVRVNKSKLSLVVPVIFRQTLEKLNVFDKDTLESQQNEVKQEIDDDSNKFMNNYKTNERTIRLGDLDPMPIPEKYYSTPQLPILKGGDIPSTAYIEGYRYMIALTNIKFRDDPKDDKYLYMLCLVKMRAYKSKPANQQEEVQKIEDDSISIIQTQFDNVKGDNLKEIEN